MLLTQLLAQHPEAIIDIVHGTPAWVGGLLAALLALGFSATRDRDMSLGRLVLLPIAMPGLALWGVQSAFGSTGHLAALLALWAICAAAVLADPGRTGECHLDVTAIPRRRAAWSPKGWVAARSQVELPAPAPAP